MKHRNLTIVALALFLCTLAMAGGPYEAGTADTDLKTLVGRWASIDGKRLIWQADGNAKIKDVEGLNEFSKLNQAKTFNEALNRLNRELKYTYNDLSRDHPSRPLTACVFDDAIVIRTIEQPDCSKSL